MNVLDKSVDHWCVVEYCGVKRHEVGRACPVGLQVQDSRRRRSHFAFILWKEQDASFIWNV